MPIANGEAARFLRCHLLESQCDPLHRARAAAHLAGTASSKALDLAVLLHVIDRICDFCWNVLSFRGVTVLLYLALKAEAWVLWWAAGQTPDDSCPQAWDVARPLKAALLVESGAKPPPQLPAGTQPLMATRMVRFILAAIGPTRAGAAVDKILGSQTLGVRFALVDLLHPAGAAKRHAAFFPARTFSARGSSLEADDECESIGGCTEFW